MKKTALSVLLLSSLLAACSSTSNDVAVAPASSAVPAPTPGQRIVVVDDGQLLSLDSSGQNPLYLTKGHQDADPNFRPDGSDLIFTRQTDSGRLSIFRLQSDGSAVELTPNFPYDTYDPDYSFDARTIVFSAQVSAGDRDIYTMNADGSGITQITQGPESDRHPDVSPDGTQVVFQRNNRLALTGPNGGAVTDVAEGAFPSYALTGEIVFSRADDLWSYDQNSTDRLTNSRQHEFDPQVGADGTIYSLVASSADQAGTGEIYSHASDGTGPRQLTTSLGASRLTVASSVQVASAGNKFTANAPYAHSFSPFTHGIGVCYGHFKGRAGNVQTDMNTLTQTDGFKSLHIYNLFNEGSLTPDPDMKAVLDYAAAQSPRLEILLGTLNSEVTGTLQSQAGATQYVAALKPFLDTGVIKVIGLGNEPNDKSQANLAPDVWSRAAQNLRGALTAAGYTTPISACLLFGGVSSYPPAQAHFEDTGNNYSMLGYMQAITAVNPGRPFVFVNMSRGSSRRPAPGTPISGSSRAPPTPPPTMATWLPTGAWRTCSTTAY